MRYRRYEDDQARKGAAGENSHLDKPLQRDGRICKKEPPRRNKHTSMTLYHQRPHEEHLLKRRGNNGFDVSSMALMERVAQSKRASLRDFG